MSVNSEILIPDTSCLIILYKINELELLSKLGKEVFTTPTIKREFGIELPDWIRVKEPANFRYQKILAMDLDEGEASAIALSFEIKNAILILDDLKGRKMAERLHLKYAGTFGLILKAKQEGIISEVSYILEKMKKTNFRFSEKLLETILDMAGE